MRLVTDEGVREIVSVVIGRTTLAGDVGERTLTPEA